MKLSDIPEHVFMLEVDNVVKRYDAWELLDKISMGKEDNVFDNIRLGFNFPTSKEVELSTNDPKPRTLTKSQCMVLQAAVNKFISELECVKTIQALNKA
jgi:hypothetical protein